MSSIATTKIYISKVLSWFRVMIFGQAVEPQGLHQTLEGKQNTFKAYHKKQKILLANNGSTKSVLYPRQVQIAS